MPPWLNIWLNIFSVFPFLFGVIYYKKVEVIYRPFLIVIIMGSICDWISLFVIHIMRQSNAPQTGIYILLELWLLLWFFCRIRPDLRKLLMVFAVIGTTVWITDNLILHTLHTFNPLFRIVYSFMIVSLSIDQMNKIIFEESIPLQRNGVFIVCSAFLLYYTYKAIFETFFFIPVTFSNQFYRNLFSILKVVNETTYIIFIYAIVCLPKKAKYS